MGKTIKKLILTVLIGVLFVFTLTVNAADKNNDSGLATPRIRTAVITWCPIIKWKPVKNATGYYVYRYIEGRDKDFVKIGKTYNNETEYWDMGPGGGDVCHYKIAAYNKKGVSKMSEEFVLTNYCCAPFTCEKQDDSIIVKMRKFYAEVGWYFPEYEIYRKVKGTTDWKKIGQVNTKESFEKYGTGIIYKDEDVEYGTKYEYIVRGFDKKGKYASLKRNCITTLLKQPVIKVSSPNQNNEITISWNKVKGCKNYVLYIESYKNGSPVKYRYVLDSDTLSYKIKNTDTSYNGKTKIYIYAVNGHAHEKSNVKTISLS